MRALSAANLTDADAPWVVPFRCPLVALSGRANALMNVRFEACSSLSIPQTREQFANLARTWIRLADDLERTLAILGALDDETGPKGEPPNLRALD